MPVVVDDSGAQTIELKKNGNTVTGYTGGKVTAEEAEAEYELTITDKAGNSSTIYILLIKTPTNLTAPYGTLLKDVENVPEGFSWQYGTGEGETEGTKKE